MKSVTELEVAHDSQSEGGEEQMDASEGRVVDTVARATEGLRSGYLR